MTKRGGLPKAVTVPFKVRTPSRYAAIRGGVLLLAMLGCGTLLLVGVQPAVASVDCTECHVCPRPTKTDPCLKPGLCARHGAMEGLDADRGPTVLILDELEKLYGPTRFDHRGHAHMAQMSGGCELCHHFTPPDQDEPACKTCHSIDGLPEDIGQPGLRGAYHRSCMACHRNWDPDPGCEICHLKKVDGEPIGAPEGGHYPSIEIAEMMIYLEDSGDDPGMVPFHHGNHAQGYELECTTCHIKQGCEACHVRGQELQPMGAPDDRDLHSICFECHDEDACEDCHGLDPAEVESVMDD